MKTAYKNMRNFWLDTRNLENRNGVMTVGTDQICVAGVEMAVADGQQIKCVFIATNSLGDSSLYFENNSPSGIGGFIGGHDNTSLQEVAARMLAYAGKLTSQMQSSPAREELPPLTKAGQVRLLAVSKEKVFYTELNEVEVRKTDHPFYPFFAYSQQMIGLFRTPTAPNSTGRA